MTVKVGIIGGSGLYNIGIIKNAEEIEIITPFGKPSDKITIGKLSREIGALIWLTLIERKEVMKSAKIY